MLCLILLWNIFSLSDAEITSTPNSVFECDGRSINLKWVYNSANIVLVEWKFNENLMLQYIPSQPPGSQYTYSNGYTSAKLTHISNGEINITSLTSSDSGNYKCKTTYSSGSQITFETQMTLSIYDMISTNLTCSYNTSANIIDCSVIPSSITSLMINGQDHPTSSLPISGSGSATYIVCMKGDAAECRNDGVEKCITIKGQSPTLQTSTLLRTERITSLNNIFEMSTSTTYMISGGLSTTFKPLLASSTYHLDLETTNSYVNTESTNFNANSESTNSYVNIENSNSQMNTASTNLHANIETITFYAKSETTNFYANYATNEIQRTIWGFISTTLSTDQSKFIPTETNDISGSFLANTSMFEQILYSSKIRERSVSFNQTFSEIIVTLPYTSVSNELPSSIVGTWNYLINTTQVLTTSYLDDANISIDQLTDGFRTFTQEYSTPNSASFGYSFKPMVYYSSLKSTEYNETIKTDFMSSFESNTASGMYSTVIVSSGKSEFYTSSMSYETQPFSNSNNNQGSTTEFTSTHLEPLSQYTDEIYSTEKSEYFLTVLQPTSLVSHAITYGINSSIETANMPNVKSQYGSHTIKPSFVKHTLSMQTSTDFSDFETTSRTTTISVNDKTTTPLITPSSQQTNSGTVYVVINTSFKDSSFSLKSFSRSFVSYDPTFISLSSEVRKSIPTLPTKTKQSGLTEKTKTIIFISTSAAVVTIIVILSIATFTKLYLSKDSMKARKEDNNISWSNNSRFPKTAFSDFSFTSKNIHPMLNTSSTSFKMNPYENNWKEIV